MSTLAWFALLALAALIVAWVVNALIALLSGERPRDTGRVWLDALMRVVLGLESGWIGRMLNFLGARSGLSKFAVLVGLLCAVLFLTRSCGRESHDPTRWRLHPAELPVSGH